MTMTIRPKAKVDIARIRAQAQEARAVASGGFWKAKDGKNHVRVVPFFTGKGYEVCVRFDVHRLPAEVSKADLACRGSFPLAEGGFLDAPCPVCIAAQQLYDSGNVKKAQEFAHRPKWGFLLWDTDSKLPTPQVALVGSMVANPLLQLFADEEEYPNIMDPVAGRDIIIERKGSGLGTEYHVKPRDKERSSVVPDAVLDKAKDLYKFFAPKSYEELHALVSKCGVEIPGDERAALRDREPSSSAEESSRGDDQTDSAVELGFADAAEMGSMLSEVDESSKEIAEMLSKWEADDGTKDGLSAILSRQRELRAPAKKTPPALSKLAALKAKAGMSS